jgi:hypothetical protein
MKLPRDITSLSWEELLVLVGQLERQVAQLSASLEALQAEQAPGGPLFQRRLGE